MLTFLKKIPFWIWIVIFVAILFLWQGLSGFSYSNKLWNMVKDQIVTDQSKVVKTLEDSLSKSELEIGTLQDAKAQLQKDKAVLKQKADESSVRVNQLNGEIDALNKELDKYRASNDPNLVIQHLHDLGIRTINRR